MCIGSRYIDQIGHAPQPLSHNQIHQNIVILARDHLMWAFAEAVSTVEVVQAIVAMSLWKEPDDDKATFYFNRVGWNCRLIADSHLRLSCSPRSLTSVKFPLRSLLTG